MAFEDLIYESKNHIATITINRPETLNALRMQTKKELDQAIDIIAADEDVWGVIITGVGKAFVSGSDISEIAIGKPGSETSAMSRHAQAVLAKIENLEKPVIAAINGFAMGGGLELALACDLRVASKNAKMGLPEAHIGVFPCYGGTQRLPRLIGAGLAKELLFTAKAIRADEAFRIGLVNRVTEPDELMDEAIGLMREILKNAPRAVGLAKHVVNKGLEMTLEDGLAYESEMVGVVMETEDATEGVSAFLEKRPAVFKNR